MTKNQIKQEPSSRGGVHWLKAAASLTAGSAFFALWFWLLPTWLNFHVDIAGVARWRWIAALPSVIGFAVALKCVWDFGCTGRGTPAPMAPPQRLVIVGFYRYVPNPMYLGLCIGWLGLWVVFGRVSQGALTGAIVAGLAIGLFVRLYEEPTLRKKFGAAYDEYCMHVPRWIPRLRAWAN